MLLQEAVRKRVLFNGKTPGGCDLVLKNLLDCSRDVCQFMQLFNPRDIAGFYFKYQEEIDDIVAEDEDLLEGLFAHAYVKLALEKCLVLVEQEMKIKCEV